MKVLYTLIVCASVSATANQTVTLAVGYDHNKMVEHYPFYAASWHLIGEELALLGYQVRAVSYPWARAKESVRLGKSDGLFLAANFKGRENWAKLTHAVGKDEFGLFYNEFGDAKAPIGSVRLLSNYGQLSFLDPKEQLKLTTAQEGLKLLSNKKLSAFVMSRSYGNYILDNELKTIQHKIAFNKTLAETYTAHIAVGKAHPNAEQIITLFNQAIRNGIESKRYLETMKRFNVMDYQRIITQ